MEGERNILTVPLAIVVAGIFIAGAIFFSNGGGNRIEEDNSGTPAERSAGQTASLSIRSVGTNDHIRGNPEARLLLVEYSDTECPFCKVFHETLKRIMNDYGKSGEVAWIYRHFPLAQLHPKAPREAEALECAGELGGNVKFWEYTDKIFEVTPSNNGLDLAQLPLLAEEVGLEKDAFESCLDSGRNKPEVEEDYNEAVSAGGNGTPYNIIIARLPFTERQEKELRSINAELLLRLPPGSQDPVVISDDKTKVSIGGAFPYELVKRIIDLLLE